MGDELFTLGFPAPTRARVCRPVHWGDIDSFVVQMVHDDLTTNWQRHWQLPLMNQPAVADVVAQIAHARLAHRRSGSRSRSWALRRLLGGQRVARSASPALLELRGRCAWRAHVPAQLRSGRPNPTVRRRPRSVFTARSTSHSPPLPRPAPHSPAIPRPNPHIPTHPIVGPPSSRKTPESPATNSADLWACTLADPNVPREFH
jgi:hypothetical protein